MRLFALAWILLLGAAPLGRLLAEAFHGTALSILWTDAALWRAAQRSLTTALLASALATAIGTVLASLLLLRDIPGRRGLLFGAILPVLVPPQVMALAFAQAGGPASPLLLALGLAPPLGTANPVYGLWGMVLVLGVQGAPLVLLSLAGLLRRLPGEALVAAQSLGASPAQALRRIAWPLLWPGLAAGAALAFVAALGNFGVAATLGIPGRYTLLPVLVWHRLASAGPGGLGQAAAVSLLLAVLAAPALWLQSRAARAGGWRAEQVFKPIAPRAGWIGSLGVGLYLSLALGLPLLALLAAALVPAIGMALGPETLTLRHFAAAVAPGAQTLGAIGNSLLLSVAAALVLAAAALPLALLARDRLVRTGLGLLDLPYALPGACTAIAAILLALGLPGTGALYGTLWLIFIAYLIRFQALALRPVVAAAGRLDPMLDAAAASLGAGWWRRLRVVHLPPLLPALAAGMVLVVLLAVNEVTLSSLLNGPGSQTIGLLVFNLQDSGQAPQASAISVLSLLLVGVLMGVATLLGRKLPAGTLPWRV